MMTKNKLAGALIALTIVVALCVGLVFKVSLARPVLPADSGDRLIGVFVTEEYVNTFDFDSFARVSNDNGTPYLTEMTTKAIELLNAAEDGFFLMVEGAHIEKFSHSNDMAGMAAQMIMDGDEEMICRLAFLRRVRCGYFLMIITK